MAATTYQVAARKKERFPTEWVLCEGDESEAEQELRQSEDARPGGWVPVSPFGGEWAPSLPVSETRPANQRRSIVGRPSCTGNTLGWGGNHSSAGRLWRSVGDLVRNWRVE